MSTDSGLYVREARASDQSALNRICLLTGDAGQSAEPLHTYGELIGTVFADPYVALPFTWGFVLVDPSIDDDGDREIVVGYIVGSYDTRAFEQNALADWWPRARARYPADPPHATPADLKFLHLLSTPPCASDAAVAYSPVHMHINLLSAYQRQGWGRRLIRRAVDHLSEKYGLQRLWLGIDPRNDAARKFYERLGFRELPAASHGTFGLEFSDLV